MKIILNENAQIEELEIIINCKTASDEILKLISAIRATENKLIGTRDAQTFVLNPKEVLYIESVDKKSYIYSSDNVYETPLKLYEIEESLGSDGYVRISKSCIVNLWQIKSLRPDFGSRLILSMNNGECIIVSRQYAGAIKEKLGINKTWRE